MTDRPHPQYEITHQSKSTEPDETGALQDTWHVHYETPSGTRSWVKLPATHYTPRNVHEAISNEMRAIEGVHALGDGTVPPAHDGPPAWMPV